MKIFVLVSYIVGTPSYQDVRNFGQLKDPVVDGFILFNIYLHVLSTNTMTYHTCDEYSYLIFSLLKQ